MTNSIAYNLYTDIFSQSSICIPYTLQSTLPVTLITDLATGTGGVDVLEGVEGGTYLRNQNMPIHEKSARWYDTMCAASATLSPDAFACVPLQRQLGYMNFVEQLVKSMGFNALEYVSVLGNNVVTMLAQVEEQKIKGVEAGEKEDRKKDSKKRTVQEAL